MKLIIDIPEGLKKDFELEQWTALSCMEMKNALEKATPIPKGHGKIADIDKVLEEMKATRTYDIPFALERVQPLLEADKTEMLESPSLEVLHLDLLSLEEIEKNFLPIEILRCKASNKYSGLRDNGNCHWWLRSPGTNSLFPSVSFVDNNGWCNYTGNSVVYDYNAVRPVLHVSNISTLQRDEDGYIIYGKLPDGSDVKWIDISEYLGEPTLLMKECLPEARRFDDKSNNYETSEIKRYLTELENTLFQDIGKTKKIKAGDIIYTITPWNSCIEKVEVKAVDEQGIIVHGIAHVNKAGKQIEKTVGTFKIRHDNIYMTAAEAYQALHVKNTEKNDIAKEIDELEI